MHIPAFPLDRNPLFRLEARRIRWARSAAYLRHVSIRLGMWIVVPMVLLWLLRLFTDPSRYLFNTQNWIAFSILLGIPLDIPLDLVCMAVTVNTIGGEVTAGRWDLLRLTPMDAELIVEAKHAIGQLRAWRTMTLVMAFRLGAVITAALCVMTLLLRFGSPSSASPLELPLMLLIFALFSAVYLLESLWRMRAMTALGLVISSHMRSTISMSLSAFGAIMAVWLSQAFIMGAFFWLYFYGNQNVRRSVDGFFWAFIICICIAGAVYGYYRLLMRRALRYTARHIEV
jgi:hypothetical protein